MKIDTSVLIAAAASVRDHAYAPYSKFRVGAALLCDDGTVFVGCNVENVSFGLTICAERVCIGSAVAAGQVSFRGIGIVSESREPIVPCGACRQALAEFNEDLIVISATLSGLQRKIALSSLLPFPNVGILDSP